MNAIVEKPFIPSPQQQDVFDFVSRGRGSAILVAVAGAGKTTTIIEAIARTRGGVALVAYNTKIAKELKERIKKRGWDFKFAEAGTVHSFGLKAYKTLFKEFKVDANKVDNIIGELAIELGGVFALYPDAIANMVGLAKQSAFGIGDNPDIDDGFAWGDLVDHYDCLNLLPEGVDPSQDIRERCIKAAIKVLMTSNRITDIIDFDDMVYLPVLKNIRMWQYQWVLADEAQDTNAARRELIRAMVLPGRGRLIAVGDPSQAIYGFTGADANALDLIADQFGARRLGLTVSFRCPVNVVRFAQQWAPHIQPAPSAPAGIVRSIHQQQILDEPALKQQGVAILCRNTKYLVELGFECIAKGIVCKIEGRDIGAGLIALARRWKSIKTVGALSAKIDAWVEREKEKALTKKNKMAAQVAEDKGRCVQVFIKRCEAKKKYDIESLVAEIESMFSDNVPDDILTLSTIHKSKGREWRTVYWLDRAGTLPSPWAKQDWQLQQEDNLCYVAATRSMFELVEVIYPAKK